MAKSKQVAGAGDMVARYKRAADAAGSYRSQIKGAPNKSSGILKKSNLEGRTGAGDLAARYSRVSRYMNE